MYIFTRAKQIQFYIKNVLDKVHQLNCLLFNQISLNSLHHRRSVNVLKPFDPDCFISIKRVFVFPGPRSQFVSTGPGPQFLFTGPRPSVCIYWPWLIRIV